MLNNFPLNWYECKFSDLCDIYTGNSINEQEKVSKYTNLDSGYNYIGTKDVSFEQTIDYENGVKIPFGNGTFKIAPKNTPLLCIEGGSAGRKLAFTEEDICFGNKLCAFVSKNKITSLYIFYFLQSTAFRSIFSLNKNGLIGGVSLNKIKNLTFPLPPLAEQERIVEKVETLFQDIDVGVEKLKAAQAQLKQYRQSVLSAAFKEKYESKDTTIGDIIRIKSGDSLSSKNMNKNGPYPVFGGNGINGFHDRCNIDDITIVIGRVGFYCGSVHITPCKAWITDNAFKVSFDKKIYDFKFIFWLLKGLNLNKYSVSTAQPVISGSKIYPIRVKIPIYLKEQQRIVAEIENRFAVSDELQKAITDALGKAEKLKQSILKKAFEGKLVPQDSNDEPASVLLDRIKKEQKPTKEKKK